MRNVYTVLVVEHKPKRAAGKRKRELMGEVKNESQRKGV
jgi:hypothetical protein